MSRSLGVRPVIETALRATERRGVIGWIRHGAQSGLSILLSTRFLDLFRPLLLGGAGPSPLARAACSLWSGRPDLLGGRAGESTRPTDDAACRDARDGRARGLGDSARNRSSSRRSTST